MHKFFCGMEAVHLNNEGRCIIDREVPAMNINIRPYGVKFGAQTPQCSLIIHVISILMLPLCISIVLFKTGCIERDVSHSICMFN